jgi:hypothetical protein
MQPEVDAPVTTRESQPFAVRKLPKGVPWNADAQSFVSTGSSSRGAMRGSISVQRLPASSVRSAGTLSMNTAAACLPASS